MWSENPCRNTISAFVDDSGYLNVLVLKTQLIQLEGISPSMFLCRALADPVREDSLPRLRKKPWETLLEVMSKSFDKGARK